MNKAIQYREDGKFYGLVNVPEKSHLEARVQMPAFYQMAKEEYEDKLQSCIAAGKEIINPEVLPFEIQSYLITSPLPVSKIFDCPDNIEFEEINIVKLTKDLISKIDSSTSMAGFPVDRKVIRLKFKTELKPVESQDELWKDALVDYHTNGTSSLKSKFTITRK